LLFATGSLGTRLFDCSSPTDDVWILLIMEGALLRRSNLFIAESKKKYPVTEEPRLLRHSNYLTVYKAGKALRYQTVFYQCIWCGQCNKEVLVV
jgi:hypothetical protein